MRLGNVEHREVGVFGADSRKPRACFFNQFCRDAQQCRRLRFKDQLHSVAMREDKAGTIARASPGAWLKRISASIRMVFVREKKAEERYDPALGDQVRLPQEFLDTVAQSRSSGMGEPH